MKRLGLMMVCFAALAMTSCGVLQTAVGSNAAAVATGQSCGLAVQGLYSAYKSTGRVDLTDATNLGNALALAACYTNLRANLGDQNYRKAFTTGLIASSAGLITSANATAFVDRLLSTAGLGNVNAQNVTQTAATAVAIASLLSTLKQ